MHHIALDRSGTHDRHLDHQVVECARPKTRQHVDLRAGFHLEHADRISPTQHVVDRRVLRRYLSQIFEPQYLECLPDTGQHPERQHIDLHDAEFVDVVLVPFDEGALVHRGLADRHRLIQPASRQHETADMLRQMPRQSDQLACQFDRPADNETRRIEADLPQAIIRPELFPCMP